MNDSPVDCQNASVTESQREPRRPAFMEVSKMKNGRFVNRPYNVFYISVGANFVRPLFVCGNRSFSGRRGRRPLQDTNIGIASALSLLIIFRDGIAP